ncbi:hypothetical protein PsYK624_111650 [Phanerochaete sordida]|uniref:Transmembrane protein n=1 Tax=Phanerochaete sordida TaxID=48140 RepID=A0A9P3GHF5_9APHY|nr:hypothetical protein PsYK624_111650 [Phanerochaete sordida]
MPSRFLGTTTVVLVLAGSVFSQDTNATCRPEFSWANNDLKQNPCEVASILASPCYSDEYEIDALTPPTQGWYYQNSGDSECVCNMVWYNLLSCCAECQGGTSQTCAISRLWTSFAAVCAEAPSVPVTIANYSRAIPDGTTVPAWAYINVQTTNNFSAVAAEQFFDTNSSDIGPPSSSASSSSSSSTSSSSSSSTFSLTSSATSSATSSLSSAAPSPTAAASHKSDAGAIAGGVVGGVAGAALIALALVLLLRKYRRGATADHAARSAIDPTVVGSYSPAPPQSPASVGKFYDPNDPTTFPAAHEPPAMGYAYAHNSSVASTEANRPSGYTGVAEV